MSGRDDVRCVFCDCAEDGSRSFVRGSTGESICRECVLLCYDILRAGEEQGG